ncbi:MAG: HAD-IA family hydrolase [Betaproteobacteria bacterium]|nr:HAD-IA family hydrolase [Betaproteobacteria bacterium]
MSKTEYGVFFDLDGTLIDTAGDLIAALNVLLAERGRAPVGFDQAKGIVSGGSRRMMRKFLCEPGEDVEPLREKFFAAYESQQHARSRLFAGCEQVLDQLEEMGVSWAIVTNKPTRFTEPLVAMLGLQGRFCSLVCGDTLPVAKPSPEPLLAACRECSLAPENVLFLGDDKVDQQAAAACRMQFAAVGWSDLWTGDHPLVLNEPSEILTTLAQLGWLDS